MRNIETAIHPVERFYGLADALLPDNPEKIDVLWGLEREAEWYSNNEEHSYRLAEISGDATGTIYFLDTYQTSDGKLVKSYGLGPDTNNQICELDKNGVVIDDPARVRIAINEVLAILSEANPELAELDLEHFITQDFWSLAGTYIISSRAIENRLDRARDMRFPANRAFFTQEAVRAALDRFQDSMQRTAQGLTSQQDSTSEANTLRTANYHGAMIRLTEQAAKSLAHSSTRLRHRKRWKYRKTRDAEVKSTDQSNHSSARTIPRMLGFISWYSVGLDD